MRTLPGYNTALNRCHTFIWAHIIPNLRGEALVLVSDKAPAHRTRRPSADTIMQSVESAQAAGNKLRARCGLAPGREAEAEGVGVLELTRADDGVIGLGRRVHFAENLVRERLSNLQAGARVGLLPPARRRRFAAADEAPLKSTTVASV